MGILKSRFASPSDNSRNREGETMKPGTGGKEGINRMYEGKRLLNMQEVCNYTGLGPTKARKWAREIGALKHIGRRALFDRVVIDKAIEQEAEKTSED